MSFTPISHKPPKPKSPSSFPSKQRSSLDNQITQSSDVLDDESEKLKSKFSGSLSTLRELFPEWKDDDLLAVLAETDGNLEESVIRITEGTSCLSNHQVNKKKKNVTLTPFFRRSRLSMGRSQEEDKRKKQKARSRLAR